MILTCMKYSWCSNVNRTLCYHTNRPTLSGTWCLLYRAAFDKTRQVRKQQLSGINFKFNVVKMCFHFFFLLNASQCRGNSLNRKKTDVISYLLSYVSKIVLPFLIMLRPWCHNDFHHFVKLVAFNCSRLRNVHKITKSVSLNTTSTVSQHYSLVLESPCSLSFIFVFLGRFMTGNV